MPYLEFDGTARELPRGETVVGSGSQAAWRVQDAGLAARHFTIAVDPSDAATLVPASSQSVVVVNGKQLGTAGVALRDGDRVSAGSAHFVFCERADRAPSPTPSGGETALQAFLVNDGERMAFPVRRRTTSIGRDAASHIVLRDPAVSRFHADVRAEAGEHVLYSMGSAGTTVNGVRVSGPQLLEEGDQVGVGSAVLRYTREPVGSQVHVELGGGELDTVASVRPTLVMQEAVTAETPIVTVRRGPPLMLVLALLGVLLGLVVVFVL
jgi:pSer/pThr/pTyr-binding forkhead associated (FHA) protein